jgi:hypothetical protein
VKVRIPKVRYGGTYGGTIVAEFSACGPSSPIVIRHLMMCLSLTFCPQSRYSTPEALLLLYLLCTVPRHFSFIVRFSAWGLLFRLFLDLLGNSSILFFSKSVRVQLCTFRCASSLQYHSLRTVEEGAASFLPRRGRSPNLQHGQCMSDLLPSPSFGIPNPH